MSNNREKILGIQANAGWTDDTLLGLILERLDRSAEGAKIVTELQSIADSEKESDDEDDDEPVYRAPAIPHHERRQAEIYRACRGNKWAIENAKAVGNLPNDYC